ncbi:PAS domain S-box protein [Nodosilinea sp. LEGE 06152]|uniref:PAS domain S-box protein n=1 Tax=Nodosilinea sp. LEGE 06152 TaxID=2777966 RepID=UPI00187E4005|nr:PAS domain S-box protein [Nodosilinea sp. LEGE 06152]MBE9155965.1 PAS domain S-box protein [Nodosilinea sp. LEGE 06152]
MSIHRTVLVIADSERSSNDYGRQLQQDGNVAYKILSEQSTLPQLSQQIDGILLEFCSPQSNRMRLLRQLKEQMGDRCPPIVVVDSGDTKIAVQVFKSGAADYLIRDQTTPDDLRLAMRSAIENAELRRKLQRSQEQFQASVETMLDCFGIFSAIRNEAGQIVDFRIDYLNRAACENNRMSKDMQLGRGLCELLPAHRESGLFDDYCRLVDTETPLIKEALLYEDTYTGGQRLARAFDIRATKLNDGFVASWRDVTDRKQLELELSQTIADLQQQQQRSQRLIDTAPIGIGVGSADGKVSVVNNAMLHLHGLTREEFEHQGMTLRSLIPLQQAEPSDQGAQTQPQGFTPPVEKELLRHDGTRLPAWISSTQGLDGTGEQVAFAIDLSQQKQAAAAIQQLNQELTNRVTELQTLLEVSPVGIAIATDAACTQMQSNAYLRQLLGVEPENNVSKSAPDPHQPPYRTFQAGQEIAPENLPMQIAGRTGVEVRDVEFDILLPNGTLHQLLCYATPLRDDQNQVRGVIGAFLDITHRNQDAAELKASQQRYRELAEAMPQMIWTADAAGVVNYRNQRWYEYTGLSEAESIGTARANAVHPDDRDRALGQWREAIAQGESFETECRFRRRDGQYQWFICRAVPTRDPQGHITGWIGTITNIDDIKCSEALVQRQLAEIEAIYKSAPVGLNVLDTELRFVRINQRLADINGLPIDAHIGHSVRELFPELGRTVEELLYPILETGEPLLNVEIQGETPAQPGVKRTWLEHFFPLKAGQRVIGISTVCEDITERIQAEAALRQSEERFRDMADNAPVMIWVTNSSGHCTYLNRGWYEFTGQIEETALGFGWLDAVHPADSESSKAIFLSAHARREPFRLEYRLRRQDGEYRWTIDAANPWFDKDGEFKGYIGSVIDISDRKRVEAALHESENRLRLTMTSAELGTWDFNPSSQTLKWDDQCKAMFGLSPRAEISWEVFLAGLHPEDRDRVHQVVLQSFNPESNGDYNIEYRTVGLEDNIERWVAARGKAFFNSAGVVTRFVGTILNITDKKRAEAEREQLLRREQAARAAAERANQIKDEFLAVLSHELRSPLNPILGWTNLLQTRQFDAAKTAEALAIIERNAKLQTQLIDDLLDVAKILRGKLSLTMTSVNLSAVVDAAIDTVKTTAVAKGISLHAQLPNVGQLSGDAARLQQIVWNLLSNAIKFTARGGQVDIRLKHITLHNEAPDQENSSASGAHAQFPYAQITVTDTGRGICPDFLPHIFESFRQEDASITRNYGGLGLGLAIVRQLVEAHGGSIVADSAGEGLGATFTVRLPLLSVEPKTQPTAKLLPQDLNLSGIRVLAVDDDPDARELLTVLLTYYGADVLTVTSAAAVLANIESFQPDVLVSDIGMPGIDGYTLLQKLRALPATKGGQIPAIALTAYAREDDHQRSISSGYQRHVTKPLQPEQLVQAVMALAHQPRHQPNPEQHSGPAT